MDPPGWASCNTSRAIRSDDANSRAAASASVPCPPQRAVGPPVPNDPPGRAVRPTTDRGIRQRRSARLSVPTTRAPHGLCGPRPPPPSSVNREDRMAEHGWTDPPGCHLPAATAAQMQSRLDSRRTGGSPPAARARLQAHCGPASGSASAHHPPAGYARSGIRFGAHRSRPPPRRKAKPPPARETGKTTAGASASVRRKAD